MMEFLKFLLWLFAMRSIANNHKEEQKKIPLVISNKRLSCHMLEYG